LRRQNFATRIFPRCERRANIESMRMYVDNHLAYSCNEPTINNNTPLVFALAATLNEH
jgi:hypothetical protein